MRTTVRSGTAAGTGRRSGFSLIEITVVMWALAVLLLLGTALLVGTFKVQRAAATALNHLSIRHALADQFRADAAQAITAPDSADQWTASPTCLLLRRAEGGHIVYRWKDGQLERCRLPDGETQRLPVGPAGTAVEFLRPSTERGVVTLRLSLPRPHGSAASVLEIVAALGGDLR
ncbi:MAG: prepilin-type N-terminal cleavage/methylation domain-containing protein [Gemmataceae bacterium]|nr:prepilin-type N-terminal cleavage/methylation domain-containing protein [Gemmataceae bacterium]